MKLNFDFPLTGLDGKAINGDGNHAGKLLASIMANSQKGPAIKLMDWAMKLWNKQEIEADDSDKNLLTEFINNSDQITNLAKAQLLKVLKNGQ